MDAMRHAFRDWLTRCPRRAKLGRFAFATALVLCGCKRDDDSKADGASATDPKTALAEPAVAATAPTAADATAMLEWLDPEAVAVAYVALPADLEASALSVVFAVPPKPARMLRDVLAIDQGLDAVIDPSAPRPSTWLGRPALAMLPMVATGTYVVRPLVRPRAEVQAILTAAKMVATDASGIELWIPQTAFPWKIAFVEDNVVAFIPTKEIGSGLGPLTAGRDLPPSEIEEQLRRVIESDPSAALELYAAGPLLHFDLGADVLQFAMHARTTPSGGLDVQIQLAPSEHAQAAAATLEARTAPLETDQVRTLMDRVAYTLEGEAVAGRLQLTAKDLSVLGGAG